MPTGSNRRPRGTGRIFQKHGNWYGQWHGLTRKLGPVREPGSRQGLTRAMAEARLRERMSETSKAPPRVTERTTVGDAGTVPDQGARSQGPQGRHDARQLRVGDPRPLRAAFRPDADRAA